MLGLEVSDIFGFFGCGGEQPSSVADTHLPRVNGEPVYLSDGVYLGYDGRFLE